jgi:hypothetical protein
MKAKLFQMCGLALFLALVPLFGGCDQERANSATVPDVATSQPPVDATVVPGDTNQTAPTAAQQETEQELENAPGKIISTPDSGSTNASNNPHLTEFVKLVEAGLGENVLMAYVTNSPTPFNISSDDILYLNDLGTPETVVTAMLQRDQQANSGTAVVTTPVPAPPQPQSPYTPYTTPTPSPYAPPAPAQQPPSVDATYADQNMTAQPDAVVPPLTPSPAIEEDVQQAPNASYSYFYDSLSPYGNWVDIEGYGPCWQPTAVVANPGWQPYGDHGHWAYTDCGWCWVSDYSWGWAPFHYGRWFRHGRFGWCWAPDTVWGPAWVSWRYDNAYCGWAPLPPTACYRPGFGFTYFGRPVGFGFDFGLSASWFVFVPVGHFHDRDFYHHRMPHREVTKIYAGTTVHNQIIRGNNNNLINRGIPVDRVAAASHTTIHPIRVRPEANAPRSGQLDRDGRSLAVFRPALPTPRPSNNPRLVGEGVQPNPQFNLHSRIERTPMQRNPAGTPGRDNRVPQPGNERPNSIIMRGPDNENSQRGNPGTPPTTLRHGPTFPPQTPAQQGEENNHRVVIPQGQQQPLQPAPRQQNQLPPPSFNRPINNGPDLLQQQQQQRELQQREFQQRQFQPQQQQPAPRQEAPQRPFDSPRARDQNVNPGFRSEPVAPAPPQRNFEPPQRNVEPRQAPEVRSAPPQYSPPARQDNNVGRGGGGGGGGGGWNNGNNNGGGGGGGGRNR